MNHHIRPPINTVVPPEPHALRGIGKPYPKEFREYVMHLHDYHPDQLKIQTVIEGQDAHMYAVNYTIDRWLQHCEELGHLWSYRRTGNQRSMRELKGQALINLELYCALYCKAFGYDVRAFLFNRNPTTPPCSAPQLSRVEKSIDLTTVAAPTMANQAYLPINIETQFIYWDMDYQHGIADVDIADMIDMDEMGLFLESKDQKFGKTVRGLCADEKGQYNRGVKMIFFAAIYGDKNDPMRWHEHWIGEGTIVEMFLDFVVRILGDLEDRYPGRYFCITLDNLNVHQNPAIHRKKLGRI